VTTGGLDTHLVDAITGQAIASHSRTIRAVFSPDGKLLAGGCKRGIAASGGGPEASGADGSLVGAWFIPVALGGAVLAEMG